MRGERLVNETM